MTRKCNIGTKHDLPDLSAAAIFATFDSKKSKMAVITGDSGTIHLRVNSKGTKRFEMYRDTPSGTIDLSAAKRLTGTSNPTDWQALVKKRTKEMYKKKSTSAKS